MHPLFNSGVIFACSCEGGPATPHENIFEFLECRRSHLNTTLYLFLSLFFIFLIFINQFSLFLSAIVSNFQIIIYILSFSLH